MKQFSFDVRLLIHATMLSFAVASLGNVHAFFSGAGHPDEVAWALAIALGSALVTLSIMLTHIDRETDGQAFFWLLATALLLGAISGSLQMHVYEAHLPRNWAVVLGFGIPLGGEVCLAFATSAYLKARDRERFKSMSGSIENAVVDHLEHALAGFNPEIIAGHVERTINKLTRLAMDSVATRALSYYQTDPAETPDHRDTLPQITTNGTDGLGAANDARQQLVDHRHRAIVELCSSYGAMSAPELSERLQTALNIQVSAQTVRHDCNALEQSGKLVRLGRKWKIA